MAGPGQDPLPAIGLGLQVLAFLEIDRLDPQEVACAIRQQSTSIVRTKGAGTADTVGGFRAGAGHEENQER